MRPRVVLLTVVLLASLAPAVGAAGGVASERAVGKPMGALMRLNPGVSGTDQYGPSVAVNTATGEYLVVWEHDVDGEDRDVYGRVFDSAGSPITNQRRLNKASTQGDHSPKAVFNPITNQYLVVWERWDNNTGFSSVLIRTIDTDGKAASRERTIASENLNEEGFGSPDVAVNTYTREAVVVFTHYASGNSVVKSRRVLATGVPTRGTTTVDTNAEYPSVVHNAAVDQYVVVYRSYAEGFERIAARRLDGDTGKGIGERQDITEPFDVNYSTYGRPQIAVNPDRNEYLVVFEHNRSSSTPGMTRGGEQYENLAAVRLSPKLVVRSDMRVDIPDLYNSIDGPDIAYSTTSGHYAVTWNQGEESDPRSLVRPVTPDGKPTGPPRRLDKDPGAWGSGTAIACNAVSQQCLVAWWGVRRSNTDIWGRLIEA